METRPQQLLAPLARGAGLARLGCGQTAVSRQELSAGAPANSEAGGVSVGRARLCRND
jgi:hypothetical protein